MIESNAISPRIKELYEKVNQNATSYLDITNNMREELDLLKEDREKLDILGKQIFDEIESTKHDFKNTIDRALRDLNISSSKALKLYNEFSNIQSLRESLASLQAKLGSQSEELNNTLTTIKQNSDIQITELVRTIDAKLENGLEQEAQKIDARLSLKVKQIENKVATYDQRMYSLNQTQINDNKAAIKDIDKLKKDFISLKSLVDESQQNLMDDLEGFEADFRKKLYGYEMRFKDITKRLNEGAGAGSLEEMLTKKTGEINKDEIIIGGGKNRDNSRNTEHLEREYKKLQVLVVEFNHLKTSIEEVAAISDKKSNIALILSSISLVGIMLSLILYNFV